MRKKQSKTSSQFEVKEFGELQAGDLILDHRGQPVEVKEAYEAHIPERMYELELEDGTLIEASGNHLWYIEPDEDHWSHTARLQKARELLSKSKTWHEEALVVAEADETPYEIGLEDLMNFFDFIEDESERYFLLKRVADSIGHIVEEVKTQEDVYTHEQIEHPMELVYDARRFFQQLLSLTGNKKWRKRWPVVVGRVVTTDEIFAKWPRADIPTVK